MQAKDDYDHAVFVHAARGERAFVMDPLGRGRYQGQWVPKADLRQFASPFTTASGSPYCAVVEARPAVECRATATGDAGADPGPPGRTRDGQGRGHDRPGTGAAGCRQGRRVGAPMKGGA